MGCSGSKLKENEETIEERLKECIDRDSTTYLLQMLNLLVLKEKSDLSTLINQPVLSVNDHLYSILSYSLIRGSVQTFSYLISTLKASFEAMQENFALNKQNPLLIICDNGYFELLKIYLPIFMESNKTLHLSRAESTADSQTCEDCSASYLPVHEATRKGHIKILYFLHEYFKSIPRPIYLDVHAIDWFTGENSALISVRTGNFVMMKFLHEMLQADFHLINSRDEGAMQILAYSAKADCSLEYFQCAMYLVEVIEVDVSYMYEETLSLIENSVIFKYFEECLKKIGISSEPNRRSNPKNTQEKILNVSVLCSSSDFSSICRIYDSSGFADSIKL